MDDRALIPNGTSAATSAAGGLEPLQPSKRPSESGVLASVFRNSLWSTFAVIASPVLLFLFGGLTLRYVGVEATGFSLAVGAVLGIAGRFGTFGVGEASLVAIAAALGNGDTLKVRRLVGTLLTVFLVSALLTAFAMVASARPFIAWAKSPVSSDTAYLFIVLSSVAYVLTQVNMAITTILRAASRYDLVTAVTTPLSVLSGTLACVTIPVYPSLTAVAVINLFAGLLTLITSLVVVARAVPASRRPLLGFNELPGLVRYGFWLLLTNVFSTLTGGIDDLVLTGNCGAVAVPPWSIGKRLWLTAHTFLAQHVEHLVPTLGSLRTADGPAFVRVFSGMHWYVVLLAAAGYTFMAWWGELIVAAVAGPSMRPICGPPIFAFSILGLAYAMLIMPVVASLAVGVSRPSFVVAAISNCVQVAALYLLATAAGVPWAYYSPLAAFPMLVAALGTTGGTLFDGRLAFERLKAVATPLGFGLVGVMSSLAFPSEFGVSMRMIVGGCLAVGVLAGTLFVEMSLSINAEAHGHLRRVVFHACDLVSRVIGRVSNRSSEPSRCSGTPR
jgi:O-antigen/teichoic acid export membrane protein